MTPEQKEIFKKHLENFLVGFLCDVTVSAGAAFTLLSQGNFESTTLKALATGVLVALAKAGYKELKDFQLEKEKEADIIEQAKNAN